ncbi:hypothetical protein FGO68_gene13172 [Halteria grandinella]|uniref:Endonuclease/exonuclease/phosphatase domain-containing protein n=1 Tax=Halteria grandinella TaxID=5974 RepID=A0A8J8T2F0_HALGN|nr:hypothetical protein FGO68_gene13172 [Halteria grandinella]
MKTVGAPAAFTIAAYFAYKRFLFVPEPFSKPIFQRAHITNKDLSQAIPRGAFKVKVLSYNILADCYSRYFMFKYVRHGNLNFNYRSLRILQEIKDSNSDIICLQEVDHMDDFYKPQLEKLGYDLHHAYRREKDAVVVGFKRDLYEIMTKDIVDYNDLVKVYEAKTNHPNLDSRDMLCHNKAIICLLKHIETGSHLIVASSHLYWDPKYDYVKYAQTAYLLKRLALFKAKNASIAQDPAIVVCGDFNSDPSSSSISLFYDSQEFVKNAYYGRNKNKFDQWYERILADLKSDPYYATIQGKLKSSYSQYKAFKDQIPDYPADSTGLTEFEAMIDGHQPYTNYTGDYKDTLDFIFHSKHLQLQSLLEMPSVQDLTVETALPSSVFPSDHLRIEASFIYNPQERDIKIAEQIPYKL